MDQLEVGGDGRLPRPSPGEAHVNDSGYKPGERINEARGPEIMKTPLSIPSSCA